MKTTITRRSQRLPSSSLSLEVVMVRMRIKTPRSHTRVHALARKEANHSHAVTLTVVRRRNLR
jgi:hypothetical protein